jgi:hypothetical protein
MPGTPVGHSISENKLIVMLRLSIKPSSDTMGRDKGGRNEGVNV